LFLFLLLKSWESSTYRYNSELFFLLKRERLNGRFQWKIRLLRLVRAVPSPFHVNRVISRLLFPTAFSNASKLFGLSVVYVYSTSYSFPFEAHIHYSCQLTLFQGNLVMTTAYINNCTH
jgi:hypothetical protein